MSLFSRCLFALALLAGGFGGSGIVQAAAPKIKDDGKFFSTEAVDKANQKLKQIYRDYDRDLYVETVAKIPDDLAKKYKEQDKKKFFYDWARERARDEGIRGIYVLICKEPGHLEALVDTQTRKKAFSLDDRDRLVRKMLSKFKDKKFDEGLLDGIDYVEATLKANVGK